MIDPKIIRKIYRDIDGDLNPGEHEELMNWLESAPEAKKMYTDRKETAEKFREEKFLEVDVKQQILNKIKMENFIPTEKLSISERMSRIFFSPRFKIGFAFVLGIFLGIFVISLLGQAKSGKKLKQQDIAGTMWDTRSYDEMKTADNILYESPMAKATFNVKYSSKVVEMHIDLYSLYPVKLAINFDPNAFMTFNVQNMNMNAQTSAMSSYNYIQINNVGQNQFVVLLYNKNSLPNKVNFSIFQNEIPLYANSVVINKE